MVVSDKTPQKMRYSDSYPVNREEDWLDRETARIFNELIELIEEYHRTRSERKTRYRRKSDAGGKV